MVGGFISFLAELYALYFVVVFLKNCLVGLMSVKGCFMSSFAR